MKNSVPFSQRIAMYFAHHVQACVSSLGKIIRSPVANSLTIFVLAIAIALPTSLLLLAKNAKSVTAKWDKGTSISIFLNQNLSDVEVESVIISIKALPEVAEVHYIAPDEGMVLFQEAAGFSEIISELPDNPLPGLIEIEPVLSMQNAKALNAIVEKINQYEQVDRVLVDLLWVERLHSITELALYITYGLGLLFALTIILVIGNTIRLIIQNHHNEINVIQLIGGTDRFIRRPFLYLGMLYGLFGGMVAWLLISVFMLALANPVANLAELYLSQYQLQGLDAINSLGLLFFSALLGLVGAWIAVGRKLQHLHQ